MSKRPKTSIRREDGCCGYCGGPLEWGQGNRTARCKDCRSWCGEGLATAIAPLPDAISRGLDEIARGGGTGAERFANQYDDSDDLWEFRYAHASSHER